MFEIYPNTDPDNLLFHGAYAFMRENDHSLSPLPYGHTINTPLKFTDSGDTIVDDKRLRWLTPRLVRHLATKDRKSARYETINARQRDKVIIINCLDYCYGHCLYKLFNSQRHRDKIKEYDLIVIAHPAMKSLIPDFIAEIWLVDTYFNNFDFPLEGFDGFIKKQFRRFKKVYQCRAYMNLDLSQLDLTLFTKVKLFPAERMHQASYQVTFVLREDRFWIRSFFNRYFFLFCSKFKLLPKIKLYFVSIQNAKIKRLSRRLFKAFPGVKVTAMGLGKSGALGEYVEDLREEYNEYINHKKQRCQIYASSHLVIGVHGSHMLLPSGLAGGFINFVPDFKIESFSEDFIPRHASPHRQAFLGRFLPSTSPVALVFLHLKYLFHRTSHIDTTSVSSNA